MPCTLPNSSEDCELEGVASSLLLRTSLGTLHTWMSFMTQGWRGGDWNESIQTAQASPGLQSPVIWVQILAFPLPAM
jgi:hypothetical protein